MASPSASVAGNISSTLPVNFHWLALSTKDLPLTAVPWRLLCLWVSLSLMHNHPLGSLILTLPLRPCLPLILISAELIVRALLVVTRLIMPGDVILSMILLGGVLLIILLPVLALCRCVVVDSTLNVAQSSVQPIFFYGSDLPIIVGGRWSSRVDCNYKFRF